MQAPRCVRTHAATTCRDQCHLSHIRIPFDPVCPSIGPESLLDQSSLIAQDSRISTPSTKHRMRNPNLNALRMFDAAARHLTFRAAAEELNLTQGAVAQQVRRLEADLGHRLFTRLPRGLALTDTGRRYHASVSEGLAIIDAATARLAPKRDRITLSVPPSLASKWLVPRLAAFHAAHPGIELRTVASEGLTDFARDAVNVAIRQGKAPEGNSFNHHQLAPLDLVAVASPTLVATLPQPKTIKEFSTLPLIEDGHAHWDLAFSRAKLTAPAPVLSFNQTTLALDAATQNQGIALAPRLLAQDALAAGTLTELWQLPTDPSTGFHVLWPDKRTSPPATKVVVDWLLSQASRGFAFDMS
ncbi:LysR substrate-binding domain-containing protein [Alisedimentitalea sp. MJ-SS2]|uniref:LysR substrate-binding domain-containing protein n=1 Tax=Aliisedimentitalea sp. MJ-SS2 TaxID=3049795 RepID=UPI0029077F92|nr:LysR substrate-binding domain-containing protein [Alisedimentitalea sp. MJ-SS2]MDU8926389.1 LysR substrate-binding domain-containing protein [Alisedimentitalea sp. MJ-SS2]